MECKKCSGKIDPKYKECPYCGNKITLKERINEIKLRRSMARGRRRLVQIDFVTAEKRNDENYNDYMGRGKRISDGNIRDYVPIILVTLLLIAALVSAGIRDNGSKTPETNVATVTDAGEDNNNSSDSGVTEQDKGIMKDMMEIPETSEDYTLP